MATNVYIKYPKLGAGSMAIGNPVGGGTPGSVLFVGTASALSQDNANFNFNDTTHALTITGVFSASNVSGTNTGDVTLGTANGLSLVGQVLSLGLSSSSTTGALSSTDWNTFNNKQAALTFGSISTTTTGVTVGSGSNSTVGPNVTIDITTANTTTTGLLTSTDWNTFNNKVSGPAGSDTQIQFNNAGVFGADPNFTWNIGLSSLIAGVTNASHSPGSQALGILTKAEGNGSASEGIFGSCFANGSHVEGVSGKAGGQGSHSEGSSECNALYGHSEGVNTRAGMSSLPFTVSGTTVTISGGDFTSFFSDNRINVNSLLGGVNNTLFAATNLTISGLAFNSVPNTTTFTVSVGALDDRTSGNVVDYSYAQAAHAEGSLTVADAPASHSGGIGTLAHADAQTAIGQYNTQQGLPGNPLATDQIFTVGIGSGSGSRADGFSVRRDGLIDAHSHLISNVSDPVSLQDAVTINYINTQKGTANGIAPLDGAGKVPYANLPSSLMTFKGAWDASTNTPTLADGTGTSGDTYRASVAGTQNLGSGSQTWAVGDFAIYNGSIWQHSPAADGVSSVNGFTGAVTLTQGNLTELTSSVLTITGGTNAVWGSGTSIQVKQAGVAQDGFLSSTDWSTFNGKQNALTFGNLTDAGTDGITITGGTGAVVGSGTAISQHVADASHNGYLSSTDWSTFNGKQSALTFPLNISQGGTNNATLPVTAGGVLATDGTKVTNVGAGTSGQVLQSNGTGAPTWASFTNGFAFFASSQVTTISTAISSTSFTTFSNSPSFNFTPSISGKYKIYSPANIENAVSSDFIQIRILNTVGSGTLLYESQGTVYGPSGTTMATALVQSVYTLTSGISYTFELQGKTSASGIAAYLRGDVAPFYMFAELCG